MNTINKPALPEHFYQPSLIGTTGLISFMLALFILPSFASYALIFHSPLPLWLALPLCIPLFFLAGQGMHLMGWIGHDGLHFNLHRNRLVSSVLGIVFSSMTATFFEMGMALDHWTHHRFTNLPDDPDMKLFKGFDAFWHRMIFSRIHCNRHYMRRVVRLATNQPLDDDLTKIVMPFSRPVLRRLAMLNLVLNLMFMALYAGIALLHFKLFLVFILAPMTTASFLSGMRPYIEHNGTSSEEHANTRSRTNALWTLLDVGANFHHEHHMYPNVPQWRLPAVHRYLREQGYVGVHQDPSFLRHYRYVRASYKYPTLADS